MESAALNGSGAPEEIFLWRIQIGRQWGDSSSFCHQPRPPPSPSPSSFSSLKNSLEFSDEWAKVLRELRESNLHSSAVQRVDFPSLLSIAATRQLNGTQKCTKSQSIQSPRILIERRQVESTQLTMETWWNQPEGKQIKIEPVDGAGQMKWKQPAPGRGLNDNRNGVG